MKSAHRPLLLCFYFLLPAHGTRAESSIPQPWPRERYEEISRRSPFALATALPADPAPVPSFATNRYVSGIGRIGDVDFVSIKSRDDTVQFSLFGRSSISSTASPCRR